MMNKKMTKEITDIVDNIVQYLKSLPDGTEISTSEAVYDLYEQPMHEGECVIDGYELSFNDFFTINIEVMKKAKKQGLILDQSKYDGMVVGLLYNIPYVITRKARKND